MLQCLPQNELEAAEGEGMFRKLVVLLRPWPLRAMERIAIRNFMRGRLKKTVSAISMQCGQS